MNDFYIKNVTDIFSSNLVSLSCKAYSLLEYKKANNFNVSNQPKNVHNDLISKCEKNVGDFLF